MAGRKRGSRRGQLQRDLDRLRAGSGPRSRLEIGAWLQKHLLRVAGACLIAVMRAIWGVRLDEADRAALAKVTRYAGPTRTEGYREALIVAGRRAGKSSGGGAGGAVYIAVEEGEEHMRYLSPGQRGHVIVVSRTQRQAIETLRYARAIVEAHFSDRVEEVLESQSGGEIRFTNGVVISVMTASASSLRGFTCIGAVIDEAGFLGGADQEDDRALEEIISSLRMCMLAPAGAPPRRLLVISSPGVRAGYLYETGARHRTDADAPVFVAHGASFVWNESLSMEQLRAEEERDPRRYRREVLAEFVDAINPLLPPDAIDRAHADRDAQPLAPSDLDAAAAVDLSTRRDSIALTIAARDDSGDLPKIVVLGAWRWTPRPGAPLDITTVIRAVCEILRTYGISRLTADQWSFDAVKVLFAQHGVELVEHTWSQPSKVQKFNTMRDLMIDGRVSLPAHEQLITELRQLDETILPSGLVRIAARGGRASDDMAFATCLAISEATTADRSWASKWTDPRWVDDGDIGDGCWISDGRGGGRWQ
jgi:hypothetical protein